MVYKLKEVLHLIEKNKTFAIDPENKIVLTKQQLGEMISADYEVAVKYVQNGKLESALRATESDAYDAYLDCASKYSDPNVLLFHFQYALAPRLPFSYREEIYKTIDKVGFAMYKRQANRERIVEAMKNHLFSDYLATKNFNENFSNLVSGVQFAENYVTVDENIAYDLLSAYLQVRDWYKYDGKKFYDVHSLYAYLANHRLLNKFSKTMESDSLFFAWLFYLGNFDLVLAWKKKVNEIDNYILNKKGEY